MKIWAIVFLLPFALLVGCGSTMTHAPAPLAPLATTDAPSFAEVWRVKLKSRIEFPFQISVAGQNLAVADSAGDVFMLSAVDGAEVWHTKVGDELSSGVGFNGQVAAVTTSNNDLVVLDATAKGVILWKKNIRSHVFTTPLIAGGRIFILAADHSVQAFDAATSVQLWNLKRPSEPLTLSQIGTLGVYRNTLLVGGSGRLLGVNPDNGQVQWETSVATTRATNDIESLVDLVGTPNRVGDSVCVRAYQAAIACVDASKGSTTWSKNTQGSVGISGDAATLISTESDGRVKSWNRATGDLLWTNDKLSYRGLSAPLMVGSSIVVGDADGYVHIMNKDNGQFKARFKTDSSAIIAAPVVSGSLVFVATARGRIFAYSPK